MPVFQGLEFKLTRLKLRHISEMGLVRQTIANFNFRLNGLASGEKKKSGFQLSVESNSASALVLFYYDL